KPENVFLAFDEDGRPLPKLLDFGLVKQMGESSSGHKTEDARAELALFEEATSRVPEDWWMFSNRVHDVLPIARLMLVGELAYREGRYGDAWTALGDAIEREDALVYDEPPGWMIPVRHAMGALLLEQGDAARAEALYREDQIDHPGNGWSLLGLAQALDAQGRPADASRIRARLDEAWAHVEVRPTSSCFCAPRADGG
ncbi:MAG: tetratricopeptide repeat protein, partial [Phycisphaerales bacterium]|nr:tetratricopeptide repeat protein [Phycisphaerales bacterium]